MLISLNSLPHLPVVTWRQASFIPPSSSAPPPLYCAPSLPVLLLFHFYANHLLHVYTHSYTYVASLHSCVQLISACPSPSSGIVSIFPIHTAQVVHPDRVTACIILVAVRFIKSLPAVFHLTSSFWSFGLPVFCSLKFQLGGFELLSRTGLCAYCPTLHAMPQKQHATVSKPSV